MTCKLLLNKLALGICHCRKTKCTQQNARKQQVCCEEIDPRKGMFKEILLSMSMDNVVKATFSLLKNIPSLRPVFSYISKEMDGLIMLANLTGGGSL